MHNSEEFRLIVQGRNDFLSVIRICFKLFCVLAKMHEMNAHHGGSAHPSFCPNILICILNQYINVRGRIGSQPQKMIGEFSFGFHWPILTPVLTETQITLNNLSQKWH
jgi:hypothetical protein